jgi:glycosyltransferase involved in cell wall biosynthesis
MPEAASHIGLLLHDFRLGGSERIAIRLAREWAARGRRVSLFVGEDSGPMRELVDPAVAIHVFVQDYHRSKWHTRRLARWAAGAAVAAGVDVMFMPGNSYFRAIPPISRQLPVFAQLSNPIVRPDKSLLRNLLFPLATARRWRTLKGLIVCCEGQAADIRQQVRPRIPLTVIINPILDAPPPGAVVDKVPGQLCAVGRLELQKNYPLMLKAFALLRDLPLTLRIAGDGNLRVPLQRLVERLGITDRVEFLGNVRDATPLMAQSEVLLLSSRYEGYPAVCMEALAAGTYVIASDTGAGVREMLRAPRTGTVIDKATPQLLAAAVRDYLRRRDFDADAARKMAAEHVIGPIAERYLQLFDTAVADRG